MAVTEKQVIEALVQSGRFSKDWSRLLTSWRAVGLMLPLATDSHGRYGRAYWWNEDDIIDRAMVVYDHLDAIRDVDIALISISLMGFNVDSAKIRLAWTRNLSKYIEEYRRIAERHSEEEAPEVMAERHASLTAKLLGTKRRDILHALNEISALVYADSYDSTSSHEAIIGLATKLTTSWGVIPPAAENNIVKAFGYIRPELLVGLIRSVAPNATAVALIEISNDAQLELVYSQWRAIWNLVAELLPKLPSTEYISGERILAAAVGRCVLLSLLRANSKGHMRKICQSVELARRALGHDAFRNLFRGYQSTSRFDLVGIAIWFQLVRAIFAVWELPDLAAVTMEA